MRGETVAGPGQAATAATGEQFYVTHCVSADSVMNSPGYSVRAASDANNAGMLRLALEYPPYELPFELWRDKPTKALAPRRLTPHPPPARRRLGRSLGLSRKRHDEPGPLVLLPPHAAPGIHGRRLGLEIVGRTGWVKEYPPKADKTLPRARLPVGTAVSDTTLTEFLATPANGPTELSVVVCPPRLRGSGRSQRARPSLSSGRAVGHP